MSVGIDWSNPFARNLGGFWLGGEQTEVVLGNPLIRGHATAAILGAVKEGKTWKVPASLTGQDIVYQSDVSYNASKSFGAVDCDFTIFSRVNLTGNRWNDPDILTIGQSTGTYVQHIALQYQSTTPCFTLVFAYNAGGYVRFVNFIGHTPDLSAPQTVMVTRRKGGYFSLFVNGKLVDTQENLTDTLYIQPDSDYVTLMSRASYPASSSYHCLGDFIAGAVWSDRAFTASEAAEFHNNPWQIFEPLSIPVMVPVYGIDEATGLPIITSWTPLGAKSDAQTGTILIGSGFGT